MNEDNKVEKSDEIVEENINASEKIKTVDSQSPVTDKVEIQSISNGDTSNVDNIQNIVENSPVEVSIQEVNTKEEVTYKDPSKLSTVLVILLFVGLFIFIFEMPKINEWLDNRKQEQEIDEIERQAKQIEEDNKKKEEEKKKAAEEAKKKAEEEENATLTLSCRINVPATDTITYTQDITETFDYNKKTNVIKATTVTTKYTFTIQDSNYLSLKTKCETDANNSLGKEGYSVSCTYDDLTVTIGNGFDLDNYKSISDGITTIEPNVKSGENINDVKNRLIAAGYICE